MLIEGLLALAFMIVAVLWVGAMSPATVAAHSHLEEQPDPPADQSEQDMEHDPKARGAPLPFIPWMMFDGSGESAAAVAELYRQYYDREGA